MGWACFVGGVLVTIGLRLSAPGAGAVESDPLPVPKGSGRTTSCARPLSHPTDQSTYTYPSDGGHFDNTGLYALIERRCRYIVLVDCGADLSPCFEDVGTAVRRCRIDFGTEFTFATEKLLDRTGRVDLSPDDYFPVVLLVRCPMFDTTVARRVSSA